MKTKSILLVVINIMFVITLNAQTTYYVNQLSGNDSSNGTSIGSAFETIEKAVNSVASGDTIEIIGEYKNPSYNASYTYSGVNDAHLWHSENTIRINGLNGTSGNYITIRAHDASTILKGDGANVFRVTNSSYLKIEDFNIEGEVDNIPLSTANALQFVYIIDDGNLQGTATNPNASDIKFRNEDETNDNDNIVEETDTYTNISNENVIRPSYIDTRGLYISNSDNIIISNNTIHHMPGGGLRVSDSKLIDILDNEIYRCSAKSYSGTHALVVTKTEPIASSGYSVNILRNKIHHNYNEQYSWSPTKTIITPRIDEGKGISLQRNNLTTWINGSGRILVANNLCYWNGFSGVHTNDGYRIDFINNTCYMNSYTNTITYPELDPNIEQKGNNIGISAQSSNDIKMINNISVIDTDWNGFALSAGGTTNLEVSDNLIYGVNGPVNQDNDITNIDVNTLEANPLFVFAGDEVLTTMHDFGLQPSSPAINIANLTYAPIDDFFGSSRDQNPDLGAIEYDSTLSINNVKAEEVKVYPNPFKDQITINYKNRELSEISIYNIIGQEQKFTCQKTGNILTLDLSHLSNGLYVLKIDSVSKKIIKTN
ncbi:MAG TPA: T9SS type A sorting domain-containing protein [Flavobacteriaceae bacterium]|nr:T9SS type A sorting domain-containing protein [Flavobacteriaceae bacterium]